MLGTVAVRAVSGDEQDRGVGRVAEGVVAQLKLVADAQHELAAVAQLLQRRQHAANCTPLATYGSD